MAELTCEFRLQNHRCARVLRRANRTPPGTALLDRTEGHRPGVLLQTEDGPDTDDATLLHTEDAVSVLLTVTARDRGPSSSRRRLCCVTSVDTFCLQSASTCLRHHAGRPASGAGGDDGYVQQVRSPLASTLSELSLSAFHLPFGNLSQPRVRKSLPFFRVHAG